MRAQRAKVALTFVCDQLAETVDVHAFALIHEGERESVNKTASEAAAIAIAIAIATVTATATATATASISVGFPPRPSHATSVSVRQSPCASIRAHSIRTWVR